MITAKLLYFSSKIQQTGRPAKIFTGRLKFRPTPIFPLLIVFKLNYLCDRDKRIHGFAGSFAELPAKKPSVLGPADFKQNLSHKNSPKTSALVHRLLLSPTPDQNSFLRELSSTINAYRFTVRGKI
jgi:hypothetical protein